MFEDVFKQAKNIAEGAAAQAGEAFEQVKGVSEGVASQVGGAFEQVKGAAEGVASQVGDMFGQHEDGEQGTERAAEGPRLVQLECPGCGAALELEDGLDTYKCPYCGARLHLDYGSDGVRVAQVEARTRAQELEFEREKMEFEEEVRQRKQREEEKSENKGLIICGVGLLLCFAMLFGLGFLNGTWSLDTARTPTESEVKLTVSAKDLEGQSYQTVVQQLQDAGFDNVNAYGMGDLHLLDGVFTKEGSVATVSIGGVDSFGANRIFPKDARVTVSYHSY